ncbi:MAG TPA: peptidoglycan DD-metalloendopeptidase family protein [Solirubrobacterales bacterium]
MLLTGATAGAAIGPGGAPTPAGDAPPPPSPAGKPAADAPSAGNLSLLFARTAPRKSFYFGVRYPSLRYGIGSDQQQNDLRIDVVNTKGEAVFTFYRNDVEPNVENSIRWDGTTSVGRPVPNGRYRFRIQAQAGGTPLIRAKRSATRSASRPVTLGFAMYAYAFPLLGSHDFGSSGARFGAGRSGHTHQGHDVMARCGIPIVAARGGRVQYSGWDGAAGNYVVIDGRGSRFDMAYMHMLRPSLLKKGALVRTGEPIGVVGSTGSSTACHLHFEMWGAPGWYEGGSPVDPLSYLLRWDRYS